MNAWTLPDGHVLAVEHAYRRDTLRAARRPLPDLVGAVGHLVDAARRTLAATRPDHGRVARAPRTVGTTRAGRPVPSACDLTLGHSAVCR